MKHLKLAYRDIRTAITLCRQFPHFIADVNIRFFNHLTRTGELPVLLENHERQNFLGNRLNRLHMRYSRFFQEIRDLEGDVVEAGVGVGRTFCVFSTIMYRDLGLESKKLFGFDSFEGFPETHEFDRSSRNPKKGEWNYTNPSEIIWTLKFLKCFSEGNIYLVKGFFSNEIFKQAPTRIALLHLDCDLYSSYKTCLESLWPRVVKGGITIFDEYRQPNWPGATKAIDEYFEGKGVRIRYDDNCERYFVKK